MPIYERLDQEYSLEKISTAKAQILFILLIFFNDKTMCVVYNKYIHAQMTQYCNQNATEKNYNTREGVPMMEAYSSRFQVSGTPGRHQWLQSAKFLG